MGLDPNADLNTESSGDAGINLASQAKKPVVDNKIKFSPTHELPSGTLVVESEDEKGIWVDEEGIEYESVAYPLPSNTDTKDANNEPNNTRNLESNSEPTRNGNGSIQAPVQATRERNRSGSGGVGKPTNKERDSSVAGNTIPNVSPTDSRAGSNNSVDSNTTSRESVAAKEGAPRNNERKRSTADGKNGLSDAKSSPAKPIKEDANLTPLLNDSVSSIDDADIEHVKTQDKPSTEFQEKVQEQIAAESIPHIENDLKNIQDTLPILQPEQHDDVKFAEARFNDPKAAHLPGVLFTNGTGTGKTFTGLGVAKRFQRQGKDNILIIVPSDKIANDWKDAASHFNMSVKMLDNTKDNGGSGPVVTTYANFGNNPSLLLRNWDLIIPDESHKINQNEAGNPTWAEYMLDAVSAKHELTENSWGMLVHDLSKWEALDKKIRKAASISDKPKHFSDVFSTYYYNSGAIPAEQKINFEKEVRALTERSRARLEKTKPRQRSKVAFLSATPFAYHKSMRYAAGYLFELPKTQTAGYNVATGFDAFLQNKFGYTMRHGKLNRPPAEVDTTLAERNLNEELQKAGAIRGRRLKVDADYSRQFVLVDDAIGSKIEDGISFLMRADKYSGFTGQLRERFDHLARLQLLEAIKVKYAIDRAKWHISKYGRKVVIFHDFKKGGNIPHPFKFEPTATVAQHDIDRFNKERPDLVNLPLSDLPSPIDAILKAFGDRAVIFNGDVSKAARNKNVKLFNDDDSNVDVILVQRDSGKEGISLHDTTGNHQRVLLDIGLPTTPTDAIQTEGRIYRFGVLTNAIIEYFTTGLDYENHAFGTSVASRSSTAENLALGHEGRNLLTAFVEAYKEAGDSPPAKDQGTGGKKSDFNRTESSLLDQAKLAFWGRQKNSKRRDQREGKDYYATPEPIGLKMAEWLQLKPNDHAAETSAGHGAIARWFPNFSRNTFIEQSYSLAGELKMLGNGDVKHEDFLNFRPARNFEGIAMNPPYGSGGSDAIKHFARGYSMLRNGGRIVALIPDGGSATKRFDDWFQSENGKDARLIAEISLPNSTFKNAGTSVKTRLIIVDKIPQAWLKNGANVPHTRKLSFDHIDGLNDLFDALNEVNFSDRTTEPSPTTNTASTVIPDTKKVVYELGGVVSDFEVFGHELDTVLDTHTNGTFQVNIDALYDKVQSEKNGKKSIGAITPPNPTTKNIIIASLSARLGQKTVNQLIRHSRLVIGSAKPNSNVAASYSNNTVTLYPENIQQGDEWAVFLHEAGEHANLSNILGQAKYQQVTNQFKKLLDENNPDAMLAVKRVPPNTPKEHIASEQLGYLIENITSNIAQTPKAIFLGKRISSFVRAWAFDKLPQWLTSHIQLTPFDIQALAARAARSWSTSQNSPILRNSEGSLSKTGDSEQTQYSIAKIFNEASKKISPYHKRTFIEGSANAARMLSNELFGSIHQSIRGIGTPSAKKISDMMRRPMEYESSTEQGAIDDIDAATTAEHGRFEGRLQDILEPISGRFGISSADREALVRGLHTGIIPKKLANTAKHLRVWLDDIKDYQEAAGLEFGYIKNYFPRSYDLKKVLNNSDDFIAMLQRHGYSKSVAEDILARIVNGDMLPEMPVNNISRIAVDSNNRIYQQRVMDKEGYFGKSSHQKQRMLDIPYDELSPFLNNDLESMLSRYMRNAIMRAEWARKFGANGEVLNEFVKNMVDEIRKGDGVTYGHMTAQQAVTFVYDAADIMQGTFAKPSTAAGGKLSRTLLNLQILSKLALASLSAAPEFLTPLLLSGSPIAYSKGFVQGMASGAYEAIRATDRLITGKNHLPQSEAYAVAEDIGVITHAEIMDMLESMHAWDSGNKTILGVAVNKFMTITLQEPITRLQKVIAVKTFTSAVRRWSKTATQSKNSDQMLRDFGIDPIEAKKWADANYPADDTLTFAINRGAIRFANSAITTPGKANKSRFFQRQNGLYPLINQFQTFSNVFGNTLLRRVIVQMKRGQGGQQLVIMAAMIGMMALAFAAQELRDEWKYGKNKPYKNAIDNNPVRRVMNAFDRAGFTGSLSRLFELVSPYKHTYNQQGAARIASLAGPAAGDFGKFIDAFLVDQDNPKKQADMQAKFIVNSLPAANAIPYKLKQDKLVDPLARSLK